MILINYPAPDFKTKTTHDSRFIWDSIRRKWLVLTPEEWVRQNFVQYLIVEKKIPATVIAVEKMIALGELKKRFDIVVYKNAQPWMIIECKEPGVPLQPGVLVQVARYNFSLFGAYLVITNGTYTKGWCVRRGVFEEIEELPTW